MNHVIILAGGKGTRMKSDLPKVLTPVKGEPILKRLLTSVLPVCEKPTIIIGHKGEEVIKATNNAYDYVEQKEQKGTGHAIACAKDSLSSRKDITSIIVLPGDHPLISTNTIKKLIEIKEKNNASIVLATTVVPSYENQYNTFHHYGRIITDSKGIVSGIVEYKDASDEQKNIKEVNLSYYCFDPAWLWQHIDTINNTNASGEYYLTDLIEIAYKQNKTVLSCPIENIQESFGINTPEQLAIVESYIN